MGLAASRIMYSMATDEPNFKKKVANGIGLHVNLPKHAAGTS